MRCLGIRDRHGDTTTPNCYEFHFVFACRRRLDSAATDFGDEIIGIFDKIGRRAQGESETFSQRFASSFAVNQEIRHLLACGRTLDTSHIKVFETLPFSTRQTSIGVPGVCVLAAAVG